jgi:hypothetical protein
MKHDAIAADARLGEDREPFVADEGDVVYVPPSTFHLARFHGPGPSTRLAITRFVGNTALVDP